MASTLPAQSLRELVADLADLGLRKSKPPQFIRSLSRRAASRFFAERPELATRGDADARRLDMLRPAVLLAAAPSAGLCWLCDHIGSGRAASLGDATARLREHINSPSEADPAVADAPAPAPGALIAALLDFMRAWHALAGAAGVGFLSGRRSPVDPREDSVAVAPLPPGMAFQLKRMLPEVEPADLHGDVLVLSVRDKPKFVRNVFRTFSSSADGTLGGAMRHVLYNQVRSYARNRLRPDNRPPRAYTDLLPVEDAGFPEPERPLRTTEAFQSDVEADIAMAREAVAALREPYQSVLRLRYFHDMSGRRIGEILGMTEEQVKQRLRTARAQLGRRMRRPVER